jgi:hypothetical protein
MRQIPRDSVGVTRPSYAERSVRHNQPLLRQGCGADKGQRSRDAQAGREVPKDRQAKPGCRPLCAIGKLPKDRPILGSFVAAAIGEALQLDISGVIRYQPAWTA